MNRITSRLMRELHNPPLQDSTPNHLTPESLFHKECCFYCSKLFRDKRGFLIPAFSQQESEPEDVGKRYVPFTTGRNASWTHLSWK